MPTSEAQSLRDAVAILSAQHIALDSRVGAVEYKHGLLDRGVDEKHRENRESIKDLHDGQQTIVVMIHKLELKAARASGYAVGAGAVVALLSKWIEHLWK